MPLKFKRTLNILNKVGLSLKISSVLALVVFLVMGFVSIYTYNYTKNMVLNQVNEQIETVKASQKKTINNFMESLNKQISSFTKDEDLFNFVDMVNYNLKKGDLDRFIKIYGFTVVDSSKILANQQKIIDGASFVYITNNDGIVIADSRLESKKQIDKYIGIKLDKVRYKDAREDQVFEVDKEPVLLFQKEIKKENETIGHYVMGISLKDFYRRFQMDIDSRISMQLINGNGIILNDPRTNLIGKKIEDDWILKNIGENIASNYRYTSSLYQSLERLGEGRKLYLVINIPEDMLKGPARKLGYTVVFIAMVGVIIIMASGYLLIRWQLNPLKRLLVSFEQLKKGKLTESTYLTGKDTTRRDELGILSKSFNEMVRQLKGIITSISGAAKSVSSSSKQLKENSRDVGVISEKVACSIQEVAAGADNQAESVDEINRKMQNLTAVIENIEKTNTELKKLSKTMEKATEEGQKEIEKVSGQMGKIKTSIEEVASGISSFTSISQEIDDILLIINSIAEQTNLLALNAAIEAARAGEAGRGFSVVAEEIRNLAVESVKSADRIRDLIDEIKRESEKASDKMVQGNEEVKNGEEVVLSAEQVFKEIREIINQVVAGIESSSESIREVNADSKKIATNVENIATISVQTSTSAQEVASASQEQTASVEEMASLSENLSDMADDLNKLVRKFKLKQEEG